MGPQVFQVVRLPCRALTKVGWVWVWSGGPDPRVLLSPYVSALAVEDIDKPLPTKVLVPPDRVQPKVHPLWPEVALEDDLFCSRRFTPVVPGVGHCWLPRV